MHEVAIGGGGLCGLALAHSLQARGVDWTLVEARERLGGRVHGVTGEGGGLPLLDLGATWFWPASQPSMAGLVRALGLATFAQADDGRVLQLDRADAAPQPRPVEVLHAGAHRLAAGMPALIAALAGPLPAARLRLGTVLRRLVDRGDHVELHGADAAVLARARRVVLALPPRLAEATLGFEPALPAAVAAAMADTPTWMASAAKAAVTTARPVWRDAGLSGNAWVTHAQAVLAEVWDAGGDPAAADAGTTGAALAGFVAIDAAQRPAFRTGLPLLVSSQVEMLFGLGAADGAVHLHDWAAEPFTCTDADRAESLAPVPPPEPADARLQAPLWDGRLWLGGSETATHGTGLLEGALGAAARLRRALTGRP